MPRTHQSKQKNKPFKGKSNSKKNDGKIASTKTKHISKRTSAKRVKQNKVQVLREKKFKKLKEVQKLVTVNEYLDQQTKNVIAQKMKGESQIKIVLLLPCNADADAATLIKQLYNSIDKETINIKTSQSQNMNAVRQYSAFQMFPISNKSYLRNKIMFVSPSQTRQISQLIDLVKCSDIVCPILSCKATNTKGMNLDPYIQGKAFDQIGYTILNMVRSLGVPTTVGIIQHVQTHQAKHHDKIIRLFKRFLNSQLGQQEKIVTVSNNNDLNKLIRTLDNISVTPQSWKTHRGYLLVQNLRKSQNGNVVLEGFLKGNCANANQLIHITGLDDFQLESIQINKNQSKVAINRNKNTMGMNQQSRLVQYTTNAQNLFSFASSLEKVSKNQQQLLSALQGLKFQAQNKKQQKLQEEENQGDYQDMSDQDQQNMSDQDFEDIIGTKQQQRTKRIQMQRRKQDQLEFQDQVEYTVDEILRQKYRNYQGLKNFKTSQWNHLQNLPQQYDTIFTFKSYQKTQNNAFTQSIAKAFAYPGFFISITVKGLESKEKQLEKIISKGPLICSFLLKHERKMTMLHGKVKRNPFYPLNDAQIQSGKPYLISLGFRKFIMTPIFSRCINGTQKTKYTRNIKQDYQSQYFCSFYYYNYFPPAPFSIYRINTLNNDQFEPCSIMYGQLAKCDPLHIILERIILCGYPYKINRRRSTIRYMFFNPKDVKFFKPIQVKTKMGLRGRIQQSLGTHGLMKVMFSDHIKHNDTVCMNLYNRVYPQTWW